MGSAALCFWNPECQKYKPTLDYILSGPSVWLVVTVEFLKYTVLYLPLDTLRAGGGGRTDGLVQSRLVREKPHSAKRLSKWKITPARVANILQSNRCTAVGPPCGVCPLCPAVCRARGSWLSGGESDRPMCGYSTVAWSKGFGEGPPAEGHAA